MRHVFSTDAFACIHIIYIYYLATLVQKDFKTFNPEATSYKLHDNTSLSRENIDISHVVQIVLRE